jgi:hypothetical protein
MNYLYFELNFVFYKCFIILYREKICIKICFDEFLPCHNHEINIRTILFMFNWYVYGIQSLGTYLSLYVCCRSLFVPFLLAIVLFVLHHFTDSDLVSSWLWLAIWYLHDSDYSFGIFMILITHLVSSWFWLPIWYLHDSDYPFGIFMILHTHLVSSWIWLPIWYLHDSDYSPGIFMILITHLVSSWFWLPIWCLHGSDYLSDIFMILITHLVSSWFWLPIWYRHDS